MYIKTFLTVGTPNCFQCTVCKHFMYLWAVYQAYIYKKIIIITSNMTQWNSKLTDTFCYFFFSNFSINCVARHFYLLLYYTIAVFSFYSQSVSGFCQRNCLYLHAATCVASVASSASRNLEDAAADHPADFTAWCGLVWHDRERRLIGRTQIRLNRLLFSRVLPKKWRSGRTCWQREAN